MKRKPFAQIPDEYEKDVWFFSKKYNLNRTTFRLIMTSPKVFIPVHKLSYVNSTAQDLYDALEDGYRFSVSDENLTDNINHVSERAIVNCRNRLLSFINGDDYGRSSEDSE